MKDKPMRILTAKIKYKMTVMGVSDKVMAGRLGIHPKTYERKRLHPEAFTYPELLKVFGYLKFSNDDILEVMA